MSAGDLPEPESYSPAATVRELEAHVRALWEMLDSDDCPFDAKMRPATRERMERLLAESRDIESRILKRYFESCI